MSPHPATRRRRLVDGGMGDHGMTLVEVMVALLILTVVLSALASVLTASLRSLHANDNRVKANAVATQLLEELRGLGAVDEVEGDLTRPQPHELLGQ